MLDTAGLIVDAVFVTIPASAWSHLEHRPNPNTRDGKYRPIRRYHQNHFRKHCLANICRRYWSWYRAPRYRNRFPREPFYEYLPDELVRQLVSWLLDEFKNRENAFVWPFPEFEIPESDYLNWKEQAIRGVQEMLQMGRELSRAW